EENGVVKGVGKGTATITATDSVAGLSATATVNVLKPLTGLSIAASDTTLAIGDRESFAAVVEPADASEVSKLWRSGNPFVATVDQNGVVTAVGAGTTDIYVSASDFYASKSVTVADASDASDGGKPSLVSFYSPTGYSFSDIADMVWAQAAVYSAVESGAINPDSETVFGAKRNIKRDEFVSVVIKTLGLSNKQGKPEDVEALKSFTDVSEDNPYYAEIMKALELGIIQGVSETEIAPDIDITRQDMAVVVANAFKAASIKTEEGRLDFVDKDSIAEYAQTSVRILAKMGIIVGKGEGYYDPLANTTRAEIAVIVDRITALR
ncbi:MAG: S-layer homology domain-containing protein, partial [Clostridia bacterium]|nr:S-layer homology domain-containing protein [Clostridia bacterium]